MDILKSLKELPPILYKYRRFDDMSRSLDIIRNGELWHTSVSKLNDPFDCAILYTVDASMLDMRKYIRESVKRHFPEANKQERRELVREAERRTASPKWRENVKREIQESRENGFGICCLSAPRDELLLWAHYADEHSGLCIGLSMEKLGLFQSRIVKNGEFIDLLKVEYSAEMPTINFIDSMLTMGKSDEVWQEDIKTMISTKSIDWSYEQEYRLVYWGHPNELVPIGSDAIAKIILGCRCSDANQEKTLEVVPDGVPVYQAEKKERIFGLDFEQIQ